MNLVQVSTLQGAPGRGYRIDSEAAAGGHLIPLATSFHMTQEPIHGEEFTSALGRTSSGMGVSVSSLGSTHRGVPNAEEAAGYQVIPVAAGVRRLTPRECERLQGFPDDFTLIPGMKCPDSRRYAAMGNAVTTNVAEWIGRRIHAIHTTPQPNQEARA